METLPRAEPLRPPISRGPGSFTVGTEVDSAPRGGLTILEIDLRLGLSFVGEGYQL